jgi:peptide deformylase
MTEHDMPDRLQLVSPSSEVLNEVAKSLSMSEINSGTTQTLIDQMFAVAHGEQGDISQPTLVGLAAPQVGVSKRIIIVGTNAIGMGEEPELKEFINPEITQRTKETELGREGCFSTGEVCGIVERAQQIQIMAFDRQGNEITETLTGFPARVFQHEVDHLDGIRFPDRITDDKRLHRVHRDQFGDYRKDWETWPQLCTHDEWEAVKSGK